MKPSRTCCRLRQQRGVAFVEIALTAAIFFSTILGLFWFSRGIGARTNLVHSMGDALRFGVTRGTSLGPMDDLKAWRYNNAPASARLRDVLCFGRSSSGSCSDVDFDAALTSLKGSAYSAMDNNDIPLSHWLAMLSVHEYMRVREGKSLVRYPCNQSSGCLACVFLNPASMGNPLVLPDSAAAKPLNSDFIGIRCTYHNDYGLLSMAFNLLGNGTGGSNVFAITRSFYINRYRET